MEVQTGSPTVAQVGLELTMYPMLALNLHQLSHLGFPSPGITGLSHHHRSDFRLCEGRCCLPNKASIS